MEHHLLIVTRAFEEQTSLLTPADFEAVWVCMQEYDGLAFYNAGDVAGASQRHKHFQIVQLPLFSDGPGTAIDHAIATAAFTDGIGRSSMLPFEHAIVSLSEVAGLPTGAAATGLLDRYSSMLRSVNIMDLPDDLRTYNLLVTRGWMMLVPRSRERFKSISMNALGFAGELLVMDPDQLQTLRRHGPMAALRAVAN